MAWCTKNPCWLLELRCLLFSQAMDRPRNHHIQTILDGNWANTRPTESNVWCTYLSAFGFWASLLAFPEGEEEILVSHTQLKPILALVDTLQTANKSFSQRLNKVPVTFLRAVQQWWQLRQPPCEASQPTAERSRWGCWGKDGGSIHLCCFQSSLWKATAHSPTAASTTTGYETASCWQQTEGGWRNNSSSCGFLYGGERRRTAEGVGIYVSSITPEKLGTDAWQSALLKGVKFQTVWEIKVYWYSFLSKTSPMEIPLPANKQLEVFSFGSGIELWRQIFNCLHFERMQKNP